MISMRRTFEEYRTDIYNYGCNTHLMNLVGTGVSKTGVMEDVGLIQHFFKDHTFARETLKKSKACLPVLPNETRWGSQYDCLKLFVKNQSIYMDIAKDSHADVPSDIFQKLMDFVFFNNVKESVQNLKPITKALKSLQAETSSIANAIKFWIDIIDKVQIPSSYQKRFEEILVLGLPSFACAAYLLHPKYRGMGLPQKFTEKGLEWIEKKSSLYVSAQVKLSQNDKIYYFGPLMNEDLVQGVFRKKDKNILKKQISGWQWWNDMGQKMGVELPAGLSDLAQSLQMLPASSSGIERSFSKMGSIMTDLRNNLGIEKASKLCTIYRALYEETFDELSD